MSLARAARRPRPARTLAVIGLLMSRQNEPQRCTCFGSCFQQELNSLLRRLPSTVRSTSSPWMQYLNTVYGEDLSLPFDLTRLRFFYHSTNRWNRHHHPAFWPMHACTLGNTIPFAQRNGTVVSQGGLPPGRGARPENTTRPCAPEYCAQWLSTNPDGRVQNHSVAPSLFQIFFSASDAEPNGLRRTQSVGTIWSYANDVAVEALPSNSWIEVWRWQHGLRFPEGLNGFGVYCSRAPGSGMWANLGHTEAFASKVEAHAMMRTRWLQQEGAWELYHGENVTIDACGGKNGIACERDSVTLGYLAYALGLDSVQVLHAWHGHSDLIFSYRSSVLRDNCTCVGCSAWRTMRVCGRQHASEASACGHLDIRLGVPPYIDRRCECVHEAEVMSCANGPTGTPPSALTAHRAAR